MVWNPLIALGLAAKRNGAVPDCLQSVAIPSVVNSNENLSVNMEIFESKIPFKLFQTAKSNIDVNPYVKKTFIDTVNLNSGLKCFFFSDEDAVAYISGHFGQNSKELRAFQSLRVGAYKADIFRLCVLWKEGGFYKDINKPLVKPLRSLALHNCSLLVFRDFNGKYVFQGLIGACQNNKHIKFILDHIVSDVLDNLVGPNNLWPTGPGAFGKYLNLSLGRKEDELFYPGIHEINGSRIYIGQVKGKHLYDKDGELLQLGRYKGWKGNDKNHYSHMWPDIYSS
jgi:hypothetical protein